MVVGMASDVLQPLVGLQLVMGLRPLMELELGLGLGLRMGPIMGLELELGVESSPPPPSSPSPPPRMESRRKSRMEPAFAPGRLRSDHSSRPPTPPQQHGICRPSTRIGGRSDRPQAFFVKS